MSDSWAALLDDSDIDEVGGEHTNDGVGYACFTARMPKRWSSTVTRLGVILPTRPAERLMNTRFTSD